MKRLFLVMMTAKLCMSQCRFHQMHSELWLRVMLKTTKALFLIDVKTGQSQRLTHDFVDIHGVDWHPSKAQLAFSAVEVANVMATSTILIIKP